MKFKPEDRRVFTERYNSFLKDQIEHLEFCRSAVLEVMDKHDFRHELDFKDFAEQSFLYYIKGYYDHHNTIRELMQEAKDILESVSDQAD